MSDGETEPGLARAIARASHVLLSAQRADGSWEERSDVGPVSTANVLVALHWSRLLPGSDLEHGARWLRAQQLEDGSFRPYPFAPRGNLSSTAQCWAALAIAPGPENAAAAARAERYVSAHGGLALVVDEMRHGDVSSLFLALAGLLAPDRLPAPPLLPWLSDRFVGEFAERFHFGIAMGAMQLSLIAKRLRGEYGADGSRRSWLEKREHRRAVELVCSFQNADGSWNSNTVQTALAVPALIAAGLSRDDERVRRASRWLLSRRVVDSSGTSFDVFSSDVWSTAFTARALMLGGVGPNDPRMVRAMGWLLDAQLTVPQPEVDNRRPGALRTGGWAFQTGNETMADCDDAGIVLSTLGLARGLGLSDRALLSRIDGASRTARAWLRGMQNPDGGWPAFVWSVPGIHPDRLLFTEPPDMPPDDLFRALAAFRHPPPELGDPSAEDLTARVLHGLGALGADTTHPEVDAAIRFLRQRQTDFGAWWGRWVCNYVASTAYVLSALAAVREDLSETYAKRAVAWLLSRQNADGGWGESTDSYRDATRAGRGPSTAPLTSLVVSALVDTGHGEEPALARAVAYLVAKQRADGTWPNDDYVATNIPPDGFYFYAGAARHMPLEALARYAHRHALLPKAPTEHHGRWSRAVLEPMRRVKDPIADAVVDEIYADGDVAAVNALIRTIFENDDPVPPGLPARARAFFDQTDDLPEWMDPAKVARAQAIFAEFGIYVTFGLFCSSLPQSYAAANGAEVLVQTGAMLDRVRQRIFETAQFLFDVLDVGSLGPDGRGIRAAQRVRLMHAGVRRLILHHTDWDVETLGEPICQEDLAGTLMTFSIVTFEAAQRLGVSLSREDGDAWLHHWRVIGHLMGIEEELLPVDLEDAEHLMEAIRQRQWAPSQTGEKLARALVDLMQELFTRGVPMLDGLTPTLIRFLAGDLCADVLNVEDGDWTQLLVTGLKLTTDAVDIDHRDAWLERQLGKLVLTAMRWITDVERSGKKASFRLPATLRDTVLAGT